MAPLRCLLFSSKAETVPPIWQVLADLGIEGEHCSTAVDAVERVTTQQFQIVITDWEDQPEAAFLLKTTRELKAAQRPLTLAIVRDEARLPQALQAGANSILLKPIDPEQVRETIGTACELLRSKLPSAHEPAAIALGAAATGGSIGSTATVSTAFRPVPLVVQPSDIMGSSADSEAALDASERAVSREKAAASSESAGSAIADSPSQTKSEVLTGWSMLQARLTSSGPPPPIQKSPERSELLSYGDPSHRDPVDSPEKESKAREQAETRPETESEAALFSYISGKPAERAAKRRKDRPNLGKFFMAAAVVAVCVALGAAPRTRHSLRAAYQAVIRAGNRLLNPPPAPMPQAVIAHESFGQSSDDYKLPVVSNIPDATTDPSQIRVLPVIDPTAKPSKNPDPNAGLDPTPSPDGATTESTPAVPNPASPEASPDAPAKDSSPVNVANSSITPPDPLPDVDRSRTLPAQTLRPAAPQPSLPVPAARPPAVGSASGNAGIPSSLRSQIGSSVPQNSGSKPMEAAMSSIEPVNLPELVARQFLLQPVDPVYPAAAKPGAQRGSVALQVLIGRDGMVQDAKFLQGSLVFARAAIDAVKQWRFKPYVLNGHPVSVQSVMTLNFKPSA